MDPVDSKLNLQNKYLPMALLGCQGLWMWYKTAQGRREVVTDYPFPPGKEGAR